MFHHLLVISVLPSVAAGVPATTSACSVTLTAVPAPDDRTFLAIVDNGDLA
jgi:hypothetical protein